MDERTYEQQVQDTQSYFYPSRASQAQIEAECDATRDALPYNCGKISSHRGWYRGKWVTDTCACGHKFRVPAGKKGTYRCNCCADCDY